MTSQASPLRHPTDNLVAVLDGPGLPPRLEHRARPEPGPGQALVRVEACGLCGSDVFLQDGGFGDVFPVVPGHEAAGRVVVVGAGGTPSPGSLSVGDQVGLWYIDNDPLGEWPGRGLPHLGPGVRRMGVDVDGALAQYVVRPLHTLVRPPAPIPFTHLAVLTDAVATPYHALTSVAGLSRGESVVVVGLGGIGSNAVQLAHRLGARVIGVGRSQRSRDLASRLGAQHTVAGDGAAPASVRAMTDGGADLVVVCTDAPSAIADAVAMCRPRGRVVLVAATRDPVGVSSVDLIWPEVSITGSRGFTRADVEAVQTLYLQGDLHVDHLIGDCRPLSEVGAAFDRVRTGGSTRVLLLPHPETPPPTDD